MNLNYIIGYISDNCANVVYNSHGDYGTNPNLYKDNTVNPTKKIIYFLLKYCKTLLALQSKIVFLFFTKIKNARRINS